MSGTGSRVGEVHGCGRRRRLRDCVGLQVIHGTIGRSEVWGQMSTGAFCFLRFSLTTTRPVVPMWILRRDGLTVLTAAERYAQGIACMLKWTTRKPYFRGCSHKSASVRSCSLQLSSRSMVQRFKRGRPELSFHVLARRRCCERESTFLQPFIIISQLDSIVA